MAGTSFKKKDLQRFRKVYPYLRKSPRNTFTSDKEVVIEIGSVTFTNTSGAVEYIFTETFRSVPTITAIAVDTAGTGEADVNIFVSSVSKTSVQLEASAIFNGTVDFQAIWIAS
jgi:hypothetical protein